MNFKTLLCGLAAAAMFTACSSDEPSNGGGNDNNGQLVDAGYLRVGLELPQVKGARALNDNFDHGLADEYAVDDAVLVLFTTNNESAGANEAKYHSSYELSELNSADGAPGVNITTTYLKTVHLNNVSNDDILWGLILINSKVNVASWVLDADANSTSGKESSEIFTGLIETLTINGTQLTKGTTTFADVCDLQLKDGYSFTKRNGHIFMTNAVVSTAKGDAAVAADKIYTLQKIGVAKDVAKPTEAEAIAAPAASFYVERALAKATLTSTNALKSDSPLTGQLVVKKVEWVLDNTEPSSYIVRNVGENDYINYQNAASLKYRFIGTAAIGRTVLQPTQELFRHYWAKDPHYDVNAALNTYVKKNDEGKYLTNVQAASLFKPVGSDKPQYCHENTFDVARMNFQNTTRALLKVTFAPVGSENAVDLYVLNNNQKEVYTSQDNACSRMVKEIVESNEVAQRIKSHLAADQPSVTITTDNYSQYFDIKFVTVPETNVVKVTSVEFKQNAAFATVPEKFTEADGLIKNINAIFQVVKYDGGVAYYEIRFKHFGDDYCKWTAPQMTTNTTADAYGSDDTAKKNYLGRWGMVRNNWYEINVSTINQLGKPVFGQMDITNDDTPDDNNDVEKWISFKINILSWAKRAQNEDL